MDQVIREVQKYHESTRGRVGSGRIGSSQELFKTLADRTGSPFYPWPCPTRDLARPGPRGFSRPVRGPGDLSTVTPAPARCMTGTRRRQRPAMRESILPRLILLIHDIRIPGTSEGGTRTHRHRHAAPIFYFASPFLPPFLHLNRSRGRVVFFDHSFFVFFFQAGSVCVLPRN